MVTELKTKHLLHLWSSDRKFCFSFRWVSTPACWTLTSEHVIETMDRLVWILDTKQKIFPDIQYNSKNETNFSSHSGQRMWQIHFACTSLRQHRPIFVQIHDNTFRDMIQNRLFLCLPISVLHSSTIESEQVLKWFGNMPDSTIELLSLFATTYKMNAPNKNLANLSRLLLQKLLSIKVLWK